MIDASPPTSFPGHASRVLVAVAHPDDETFATGSLLLHLQDLGVATAVCCASRGEAGDVREGVVVPPAGIGALREAELRAAAAHLGVGEVHLLGLLDSGMAGEPAAGSIVAAGHEDVVRRLSAVVGSFAPDVLVTLDASDGHRDHVVMREATVAVGRERGLPVWLQCLPRSIMREWALLLAGSDPDSPYLSLGELGTAEEDVMLRIDTTRYYERRWEAIRLHASQTSAFGALPDHLQRAFLTSEPLLRRL